MQLHPPFWPTGFKLGLRLNPLFTDLKKQYIRTYTQNPAIWKFSVYRVLVSEKLYSENDVHCFSPNQSSTTWINKGKEALTLGWHVARDVYRKAQNEWNLEGDPAIERKDSQLFGCVCYDNSPHHRTTCDYILGRWKCQCEKDWAFLPSNLRSCNWSWSRWTCFNNVLRHLFSVSIRS